MYRYPNYDNIFTGVYENVNECPMIDASGSTVVVDDETAD